MKILVACEFSGRVRDAFRAMGHDAWSCDVLPTESDPEHHIAAPVEQVLNNSWKWDMLIGFPPCTYLTNSANKHLYLGKLKENGPDPSRWRRMEEGSRFFRLLWDSPIERICLENPVMSGHAQALVGVRHSQTIQPWQFGHCEVKRTCLWLKNLPKLEPTNDVYEEMMRLSYAERARVHHAAPHPDRWKTRSRTFPGIASAMAAQWGII